MVKPKFQLTLEEIFQIAEMDGGFYDLMHPETGIDPEEIADPEFRKLWRKAVKVAAKLEEALEALENMKPEEEPEEEEDDDDEDGRFKLH